MWFPPNKLRKQALEADGPRAVHCLADAAACRARGPQRKRYPLSTATAVLLRVEMRFLSASSSPSRAFDVGRRSGSSVLRQALPEELDARCIRDFRVSGDERQIEHRCRRGDETIPSLADGVELLGLHHNLHTEVHGDEMG